MSGYCRRYAAAIYNNVTISKWDELGDRFHELSQHPLKQPLTILPMLWVSCCEVRLSQQEEHTTLSIQSQSLCPFYD